MTDVVIFTDSRVGFSRPLGAYKIANKIRKLGFTAQVLDYFSYPNFPFESLCNKYINADTQLICVSATTLEKPGENNFGIDGIEFQNRLEYLRNISTAKIAVGGGQFSLNSLGKFWELRNNVDYVCIGQGEGIIAALLDKSQTIKSQRSVWGFEIITDKDYPYENFSTEEMHWHDNDHIQQKEPLSIELSRGCIFQCGFCNYQLTGKTPGDYTRSFDSIFNEIKSNYERFGTEHYVIVDDLLNDGWHKIELLEQLKEKTKIDLKFVSYLRLDYFLKKNNMAHRLKEVGLVGGKFGIETIDKKSGKSVGKGLGKNNINKCFENISKHWNNDVQATGLFILGLPHSSEEYVHEFEEWLNTDLTRQTLKKIDINPLSVSYGTGSILGNNPEKFGYVIGNDGNWTLNGVSKQFYADESVRLTLQYNSEFCYNPHIQPFRLPTMAYLLKQDLTEMIKTSCTRTTNHIAVLPDLGRTLKEHINKYWSELV